MGTGRCSCDNEEPVQHDVLTDTPRTLDTNAVDDMTITLVDVNRNKMSVPGGSFSENCQGSIEVDFLLSMSKSSQMWFKDMLGMYLANEVGGSDSSKSTLSIAQIARFNTHLIGDRNAEMVYIT